MKTALVYYSSHHKNTEKIVFAMQRILDIDVFKVEEVNNIEFSSYDVIGFASGIYMGGFHKSILEIIENIELRAEQTVFLVYTCGLKIKDYAIKPKKILKSKCRNFYGCFSCRGYDTYGLFGKIGGISKGHPNNKDIERAIKFISGIEPAT